MGLDAIESTRLRALDAGSPSSPRLPESKPAPEPASRPADNRVEGVDAEESGVPRRLGVQQQLPPNTRLRVDKETNQIVAQILDENNEVVRQIPPEALLELSSSFTRLEGLLFNQES